MLEFLMMERLYDKTYAEAQSRQIPNSLLRVIETDFPILPSDSVLEIGSGNGQMLALLQQQTPNAFGIDINHFPPNTPGAVKADARFIPFRNSSFDKVLSIHTLEHIEDLNKVFQEMDRVLKPGGIAFHLFPANFVTKAEGAIFDAIRMHRFNLVRAWQDAHRLHVHRLSPGKIQEFAKGTDLNLIEANRHFVPEGLSISWGVTLRKDMQSES